jgi:hypothetical protein
MEPQRTPCLPGDTVSIVLEQISHEMYLKEVHAIFTEEIPLVTLRTANTIRLKGPPKEKIGHKVNRGAEEPALRVSSVELSTQIPSRTTPGEYRCTKLIGITYGGRTVPFDKAEEEVWRSWRFRVSEEPNTSPRLSSRPDGVRYSPIAE